MEKQVILRTEMVAALAPFTGAPEAFRRTAEFFTAELRSDNTRRACLNAARRFSGWCAERGLADLTRIETVHVAGHVKSLEESFNVPSIKQHLAALKHLFDHLVTGGIIKVNPAAAIRGPRYSAAEGKTPILTGDEPRRLLDAIKTDSPVGLRDRALIGPALHGRAGERGHFSESRGLLQPGRELVRPPARERRQAPCHACNHRLQEYLAAYIDAAGIAGDPKGPLFRTMRRGAPQISKAPLTQSNVYELIQRGRQTPASPRTSAATLCAARQ